MSGHWVIRLDPAGADALAELRLMPGLEVAGTETDLWLRAERGDQALDAKLSALPTRGRFELVAPDQLRLWDRRIPTARLPELRWQPLGSWMAVESPVAALPALGRPAVSPRLVRSPDERVPALLLARLDDFQRFAAGAAQVRLDRLRFAANRDGEVLIRGTPLPPLPGRRFALHGAVAVPVGFAWQPAVNAEVLMHCLGVSGDALVLWNEDGTITRLSGEQFVPATRGAVRATATAASR